MQKDNIQDIYSLSPLQEGLFFHHISDPSSSAYFVQASYRLHGVVDPGLVQRAINELARRYDIIRTSFVLEGLKKTFQVVLKERPPQFYFEDIGHITEPEAFLEAFRKTDREKSFNLTHDPLMRVSLFRLNNDTYEFVWSHHHILMDGWCTGIIIQEFGAIYDQLLRGETVKFTPVKQYKEFIKWLEKQDSDAAREYWKNYLDGFDAASLLPRPAQVVKAYDNRELVAEIDNNDYLRLKKLSTRYKVSLNSLLQAAWGVLLSNYTGKSDIVFGTVVSVRPPEIPGVETMMGLFINTLPVRMAVSPDEAFSDLAMRVQRASLNAEPHQFFPLAEIQAGSRLKQNLLDHVFVLGNYPIAEQLEGMAAGNTENAGMQISRIESFEQVNYHFSINISGSDTLKIRFNYNGEVFSETIIAQIATHYRRVIEQVLENPETSIAQIEWLNASEKEKIIKTGTGVERPYAGTLQTNFENAARLYSEQPAIVTDAEAITYKALLDRACCLANALVEMGVEKGDYVAVKTGRGADAVISVLGIAFAGAVYVPIDPAQPQTRIAEMLESVPVKVILTNSIYLFNLPETTATVFAIDLQLENTPAERLPVKASATDIAYIIFTSGTTGKPKGVPARHESIVDRALYHAEYLNLNSSDRVMQFASLAFDASVIEITMTLLSGATLYIPDDNLKNDASQLAAYMNRHRITVGIFPPAYLKLLRGEALPFLQQVISTGEAAVLEDMIAFSATKKMHNGYGPTELCIGATFYTVNPNRAAEYRKAGSIPIGKAFSNTQLYVVDQHGRLCADMVAGELYAGGIGVSNGYINDAERTAEKFVPDTFSGRPGRLYRTGDLVKWNYHKELIYLGRADSQVQIRGIRVEPGEIENVLYTHEHIGQAVVTASVVEGNTYLLAYVTCTATHITPHDIKAYLRSRLPEYMIPTQVMVLPEMPVTASGKIDRPQLPEADWQQLLRYEPPQNELEEKLCTIWSEILNCRVGREDNFFDMGGHSLKAMQIVSALFKQCDVRIDIGQIFANPRVALLAPVVAGGATQKNEELVPAGKRETYPITPSQKRLWVLNQLDGAGTAYNITATYTVNGNLQPAALQKAIETVTERHQSLRTVFRLQEDELVQVVQPAEDGREVFRILKTQTEEEAFALAGKLKKHRFALESGPLFLVRLVVYGKEKQLLVCVMHHIISDGLSMQVLFDEIGSAYNQVLNRQPVQLPVLPVQYTDYAVWLENELNSQQLSAQKKYWLETLSDRIEPLKLFTDLPRPALQTFAGNQWEMTLNRETLEKLRYTAGKHQLTNFMILVTAVKLLLYHNTGQETITLGTIISGRQHPDVEKLIGCFINTIVLCTDIQPNQSAQQLLKAISRNIVNAYANQHYPFDQLVEDLSLYRDLSRGALIDVLVNYQFIQESTAVQLQGVTIGKPGNEETISSRFDLEFEFYEHPEQLGCRIVYNAALYGEATIQRFGQQLQRVLQYLLEENTTAIGQIPLMDAGELALLRQNGRGRQCDYPVLTGYSRLFGKQAAQAPHNRAVTDGQVTWNYQELSIHAENICRAVSHCVHTLYNETRIPVVAVAANRNCRLPALALGIWRAGCVYMPVDPSLPEERINQMLQQSGALLLITDEWINGAPCRQETTDFIFDFAPGKEAMSCTQAAALYDGAYLLFTSGSTGQPKGVLVGMEGMLNHLHSKVSDFSMDAETVVAQTASQSFDVSVWQMFAVLLCGGMVRIYSREEVLDLPEHIASLDREGVNIVQMVPSYLGEFLQQVEKQGNPGILGSLHYLVSAGEALAPALAGRWFSLLGHCRIANCYGPTEASDNISIHIMEDHNGQDRVPVGRAIDNLQLYVVDGEGKLCLPGVMGEIWVSGVAVAQGYINDAEKTAEVFMEDPFTPGRRLYKTGDLGRWNGEGLLEFHGRKDRQVKIRGQRVELAEIEEVMLGSGVVQQAAVVYAEGVQELRGYVVWKEESGEQMAALRSYMQQRLPVYMLPNQFVEMEAMPLTASGKIDRKKLPAVSAMKREMIAPETANEIYLLAIWKDILGPREFSVTDSFFECGGHSLKAMRLAASIEDRFGVSLQLSDIFKHQSIRLQGTLLDTLSWVKETADEPAAAGENIVII